MLKSLVARLAAFGSLRLAFRIGWRRGGWRIGYVVGGAFVGVVRGFPRVVQLPFKRFVLGLKCLNPLGVLRPNRCVPGFQDLVPGLQDHLPGLQCGELHQQIPVHFLGHSLFPRLVVAGVGVENLDKWVSIKRQEVATLGGQPLNPGRVWLSRVVNRNYKILLQRLEMKTKPWVGWSNRKERPGANKLQTLWQIEFGLVGKKMDCVDPVLMKFQLNHDIMISMKAEFVKSPGTVFLS
jgi:hypothetical protein